MPKPFDKQAWLDALRDPDAKQAKGQLGFTDGSRCCLGVLCDLAVEAGVIDPPFASDNLMRYEGCTGCAPEEVVRWSGLRNIVGNYGDGISLSHKNDKGFTFAQIADIIEDPANKVFRE